MDERPTAATTKPLFDPVDAALALVERRLHEPLTLADLAAASGLSPFHFARLFAAVTGDSPIAHLRRRRLEVAAARLLAERTVRLVDLAFDSGFESQEAFTRAFSRQLGVSPGRFRRRGATIQPIEEVTRKPMTATDPRLVMAKEPRSRPAFRVAGQGGVFDKSSVHLIPQLWERLVPSLPLSGQVDGAAYGVCFSTSPEEPFHYLAAVEIGADTAVPSGLEARDVPAQSYLVFRHEIEAGPLHPQIKAAMGAIWGGLIQASGHRPSGGPDLEHYPADFRPGVAASVIEYWIPVQV